MRRGVLNCLEKVKQPKKGLNGMSFGSPIRMWRGFLLLFGKLERLVCLFSLSLNLNRLLTC